STMVRGRSGQVSAAAARGTAATSVAASPRKMRHRAIIGHPNLARGTHAYSAGKIADAALPATPVGTKKKNGSVTFAPAFHWQFDRPVWLPVVMSPNRTRPRFSEAQ